MLRLSKLADYAVLTLVGLGRHDEVVTSSALAAETGVPEPTVAKVLKTLSADGLLVSQRGARGGYRLAERLEDISIARVISAVDGPISLTACVSGGGCDNGSDCALYGSWDVVNEAIRDALAGISIARMAEMSVPARRIREDSCVSHDNARHDSRTTGPVSTFGG
ncbi:SUF system Fe-S cluster assembly regulator [Acetobacter oeni]|uniref:SUF system Fe-S cluster assembly regulator n=1 Tax=Acetobacter oeni TaxID=304077 RepID=A0A511XJN5_9PROT|nr:SUF system Fe-S cluster assembly regulator [Acetobacter oeni]MBB3883371.1 FeS assembly SUF system regulator [Acetobacter oeni]NHO19461.1 SUF system Fe-S cluster assembly regulator [Acetobacter oeni]GBR00702.1 transcriptional regulator [Acetobacter oeni LMG 21952]GEN63154.1 SUF system Fe-S cluster assembly regulator [Acetobacter oeni]